MLTLRSLTKKYGRSGAKAGDGEKTAVDDLSLEVTPGKVTGFLGPNGAGKSTTMRLIMGLDRPTSGTALVNGRAYAQLPYPLREVGALLDAKAAHPRRSAYHHLLGMARSHGIPAGRVHEVLGIAGISEVAGKPVGSFSMGMGQRLGIAAALLGDPEVLLLDEPVNGLDPDGVLWIRTLLRSLAAEGRTVFLSSHLMSEMELTADRLVVIGRGRLLAEAPMADVLAGGTRHTVRVRGPETEELRTLAHHIGAEAENVRWLSDGELEVTGVRAGRVGDVAHERRVRLHELRAAEATLEEAYMRLTSGSVEYADQLKPTPTRSTAGEYDPKASV
ncbi:ATP-binding cassette domain-containing protein [Streptomyces iconiensis]|uniref:ATP-binding cassette domain-containing protein n=1 Tax=Streptomyces iconiensis TaxID=1384038 RepID=A0ABT7A7V4_9ACTN|nr:ATP-binding cassette domain-containing protein [Streptomyces iconiensis]MDJ1137417.1 ATP-binding cassette domain-containing protein [Streptomyces iconiensis]